MSLNEKYIISGSTLSDIGDALRAKSIITPTKEVTQQVCCYRNDYATSRDNYGKYNSTVNLTEWNIQYWYGINWDYPVPQFSYVRIYRETNNYSMKVNGSTLAAGSSVIVSLPVTLLFEGNYTCYVKFYPLDSNQREIPWDSSYYYPSNPNDYNKHYYKENVTIQVPKLIEVGDIATAILASGNNKQYQIYTADSSVTTGDNIHYQAWSSSGYGGLTMPAGLDYEKMVFCHIHYSNSYDFTYVRDLMPYIANSDKSQIFFPCFYRQLGFPTGSNIIKTRTLRNNNNPYVANSWYGIGYKSSSPQILTAGGVKITAISSNSITLNYQGGLGSMGSTNNSIAIFEK